MKHLSGELQFLALLSEEEGACRFAILNMFNQQNIILHFNQLEQ